MKIVKRKGVKWNKERKSWECSMEKRALYAKYKPITLEVSYEDRDTEKAMGAEWDITNKKWVVANCKMNDDLRNYVNVRNIYLCLSYESKDETKENQARWDTTKSKW